MSLLQKIWVFLLDTFQTIVIAASIFLVVYVFLFRPFQVNGESMFPNFENNEYVLTNLITLRFEDPIQGDVIVFQSPTSEDKDFIKRVIGIPGDSVYVKEGQVYVNNILLDESKYLKSTVKTYPGAFMREGQAVTVPPGEYLVMGDNRPYSSDSREFGFVKKSAIIGKSLFVYWPTTHMRFIENPFKK